VVAAASSGGCGLHVSWWPGEPGAERAGQPGDRLPRGRPADLPGEPGAGEGCRDDVRAPGVTAQVPAAYYQGGFGSAPILALRLANSGQENVAFTVTPNHYSKEPARTYHVHSHGSATHLVAPLSSSNGWYDLSVTISGDGSWSRRYVGHLEDGQASVTG